jgi:hypothetical protein
MTKQNYANVIDPHISALVSGRYRFEKLEYALKKIDYIKTRFTIARPDAIKDMPEGKHCFVMWIADYDLTPEEEEAGFMGNYAFIAPEELPSGIVTLACVKVAVDLKNHPRRRRPKQRVPNWGHPIMRQIKKGKIYKTMKAAQTELESLHLEFPEVTVPYSENKLYIMIFDRKLDPKKPTQKYVVEIEASRDGGFIINAKLNDYKPKEKVKREVPKNDEAASEPLPPQGYFTSMISLKNAKKKNNNRPSPKSSSAQTPDNEEG